MPEYRAYFLLDDDHIAGPPVVLICDDDEAAIEEAGALSSDQDIELWQLDRLVVRLPRRTDPAYGEGVAQWARIAMSKP